MVKHFYLTTIFILSFFAVSAAPVMPTVGTGIYYYIRFKATGYVIQDNGLNSVLTSQTFVPGNLSQYWKVDNGVAAGTYVLTSGNGRKFYYNSTSSRYTAISGTGTDINFVTSANTSYTNGYELGRSGISNKVNPLGGAIGAQIGEYTLGTSGNVIQFMYAPIISTSTSHTYYNIKFSRGNYLKDAGLNSNILQANLVANASDQLWRVDATSAGASTVYLVSKLGNRLCYNGSRYRAQKDGNLFSFSATLNSTYPSRWELTRIGGSTVNDAYQTEVTDWYANSDGDALEFSYVETLNVKAILLNQINIATAIKNAAVVGTLAGQYAQVSVDALTTASATTAQGVYDNISSTDTDYQNATTALINAIDTFYGTTIYPVSLSTASSPIWYYIVGATGNPNGAGKAIIVDPITSKCTWGTVTTTATQMFRFERITGSPKLNIINMFFNAGGLVFSKSPYTWNQIKYDFSTPEAWEISPLTYTSGTNNGSQYSITSNGVRLNLYSYLSQLINHTDNTYNSGSSISFLLVSGADVSTSQASTLSILTTAINSANTTLLALNGTNPGQLSSTSVNTTFQTAITNATIVKNKTNPVPTNTEITNACIALSNAHTTYTSTATNAFKYSTDGNETWYAIKNNYYSNNYIKDNGLNVAVVPAKYSSSAAFLWKIVDLGGGNLNIISKLNAGQLTNTTTPSQSVVLTSTSQTRTISSLGLAQFNINGGTHSLHINGIIMGWNDGLNSASAWKFEEVKDVLPTLTTNTISAISTTSATCGGTINSDGVFTNIAPPSFPGEDSGIITITAKGVCWSTSPNPTVVLSTKTNEGSGSSSFSSAITGLAPGVTYYVRAYATNYLGTAYGNEFTFTTLSVSLDATYNANQSITANFTGASAANDWIGLYSSTATPSAFSLPINWKYINNTLTPTVVVAHGSVTFPAGINTAGYYKACLFAADGYTILASTNFTVYSAPIMVSTTIINTITETTAISGGVISSDGLSDITAKGVCWSTSTSPTIDLNFKTIDGTGSGIINSSITGLSAGTMYYVRSYATNAVGTSYGPQISFVTPIALEYSTDTKNVWYSINTLGRTSQNFITDKGLNVNIKGEDFVDGNDGQLWKIVNVGSGQVNVISKLNSGNMSVPTQLSTPSQLITTPTAFTLSYLEQEQYNLNATDSQLHLQVDRNVVKLNGGVGTASAWIFEKRKVEVKGTITSSMLPDCTNLDVIIDNGAQCTVNTSNTFKSLTVEPGSKVNLSSGLTVGNVILKANVTNTFNAVIGSGNIVTGTVKYQRTIDDTKWYFMSFPCAISVANIVMLGGGTINTDYVIKRYDGQKRATDANTKGTNWIVVNSGETLSANQGYIFGLTTNNNSSKTLEFPLTQALISSESLTTVPVVFYDGNIGINNKGWNLIGQPYLSAFTGANVGINYITKHNGAAYVGAANTEVATINPFEAFFVQVPNSTPINFAVAGRQSIKSEIGTNLSDKLELTAFTSTGKDKTNLIMDDIQTAQYEIGYDLEKWVVTGTGNPQIYSILGGINYAYNTLPFSSLQNLPIGIYSKTKSTVTINANLINSSSISQLFLNDNVTGSVTDLLNSSYTFTCEAGTFNSRFNLSVKRILTDVLNQKSTTDKVEPNLIIRNYTISIDNINNESSIKIFDTTGRVLVSRKSVLGSVNIILDQKGMYVVEIITKTDRWIKKVACN